MSSTKISSQLERPKRTEAPQSTPKPNGAGEVHDEPPAVIWKSFSRRNLWLETLKGVVLFTAVIGGWVMLYLPSAHRAAEFSRGGPSEPCRSDKEAPLCTM